MDRQTFYAVCEDFDKNIVKELLPTSDHLTPKRVFDSGLNTVDDSVWSQYMELINPNMNLGNVYRKLQKFNKNIRDRRYLKWDDKLEGSLMDFIKDENNMLQRYGQKEYIDNKGNITLGDMVQLEDGEYVLLDRVLNPKDILDQVVRYCELIKERNKYPIYVLRHKKSGLVYAFVSKSHIRLSDKDIVDMVEPYFKDMPVTFQYKHSTWRMEINAILDEIAIELGQNNSMKLRICIGNSMFGRGAAYVTIGSWEKWCSNGAMGWAYKLAKQFEIAGFELLQDVRHQHRWRTPDEILSEMREGITNQLKSGDKFLYLIENANEITDPIIKKNKDIVNELQKQKFGLQKNEAQEVYALLKTKTEQYHHNNGFDIGRAIAEVARDTKAHERALELEKIASKTMFSQLDRKVAERYNQLQAVT